MLQKKLASEIKSKAQENVNSTKVSQNDEKSVKPALKGLKCEIAIFDELGGPEMGEKGKKETREVYFNSRDDAMEFVWMALFRKIKVKSVCYDEGPSVFVVTIKGDRDDLAYLGADYDAWHKNVQRAESDRTMYELRRRTAVLANALACRESLVVYLMHNCRFDPDKITVVEDLVDPIIMDLTDEITKDRPGPTGVMLDAYLEMVEKIHESD